MELGNRSMQQPKLRKLVIRLGFIKTAVVLTAIATVVSFAVTLLLMTITGVYTVHGMITSALVPLLVGTLISLVFAHTLNDLERVETELRKLAITDELTGIYNRRYFLDSAEKEIARSLRFGKPFCSILLDIDGFKRINDSYGHGVGDEVLIAVSSTCLRHCRKIDTFARYGGDEFYFLLPECTKEEAQTFAERIRGAVERIRIDYNGVSIPITASLGVQAFAGTQDSLDRLLIRTDNAMYAAKQAGKNTVSAIST